MNNRTVIKKNSRDSLVVERSEYKGSALISIRIWYSDNGELKPSAKGVSVSLALLPDIIQALQKIQREVEIERGAGHA